MRFLFDKYDAKYSALYTGWQRRRLSCGRNVSKNTAQTLLFYLFCFRLISVLVRSVNVKPFLIVFYYYSFYTYFNVIYVLGFALSTPE